MIKAYFSCADPRVTVHRNPNCVHAKGDQGQRNVLLNEDTVSRELGRFRSGAHRFDAGAGPSDLWLLLDFQDSAFEEALVRHVQLLVGRHCELLARCEVRNHC